MYFEFWSVSISRIFQDIEKTLVLLSKLRETPWLFIANFQQFEYYPCLEASKNISRYLFSKCFRPLSSRVWLSLVVEKSKDFENPVWYPLLLAANNKKKKRNWKRFSAKRCWKTTKVCPLKDYKNFPFRRRPDRRTFLLLLLRGPIWTIILKLTKLWH